MKTEDLRFVAVKTMRIYDSGQCGMPTLICVFGIACKCCGRYALVAVAGPSPEP